MHHRSSRPAWNLLHPGLLSVVVCVISTDAGAFDTGPLRPFLQKHCVACHGADVQEGGLDLSQANPDMANPDLLRRWVRVHDRVQKGEMPPAGEDRPDAAESQTFLQRLSGVLTEADQPRRKFRVRRLNRVEYENTLRDLFGVRMELRDMLPEDQPTHGFDTVGDGLALSAEQMEVYLEAADKALDAAFGAEKAPKRVDIEKPLAEDRFAKRSIGRLFKSTEDGSLITFQGYHSPSVFLEGQAPVDGTYRVRIHAKTFQTDQPLVMAVYGGDVIVGRRPTHLVGYFDVPAGDEWTVIEFEDYMPAKGCYQMKPYDLRAPTTGSEERRFGGPGLMIGKVKVEGPLEAWPPPSRARLLGDVDPESGTLEDARQIFARLLPRAYRRPVSPEELTPWLKLTEHALAEGRPFLEALRVGLQAILCSPDFLMLQTPESLRGIVDPAAARQFTLASRLSYFLWSSMPDAELLELAGSGRLDQPQVLREQVERMLADPKSREFVVNFTDQWLNLKAIDETEPDGRLFPEYDERLRYSIVEETRRFFREVLDNDHPLTDFVDSDWLIVNHALAKHYGLEGVDGQQFRRVALPEGSVRGGVLTQASVLKVSANGSNTSPVVRGVWVLDRILNERPAPPPPGVSAIEPDIRGATTVREQLERHRNVSSCASCHQHIDPPGFALENFNPIGGWRDWYRSLGTSKRVPLEVKGRRVQYGQGPDVDASGQTVTGEKFTGPREFKQILLQDKPRLARGLAGKLMTYGLGRGLGFSDRPAVEAIIERTGKQQYGFRSLIHEIVQSDTFRGEDEPD